MGLERVPITFSEAAYFVKVHHRHHVPPVGHKYSIACALEGEIVGVIIVGRPIGRHDDKGWMLEVTRCCVKEGVRNACSFLYSSAWNAAKYQGYRALVTFTLESESGTSLKAAGWKFIGKRGGGSWNVPSRPRVDKHPTQMKLRWEISL